VATATPLILMLPERRHVSLSGRVTLVTGASSGIGRTTARRLATRGCTKADLWRRNRGVSGGTTLLKLALAETWGAVAVEVVNIIY
jgi:NAD(P)-dependent dehydrogenase (short-subunit alcohol dehydrogenase family)